MEFPFVDNSNIDARTRKQIRSQVMRGKNVGKKKQRVQHGRGKLAILTAKSLEPSEKKPLSSGPDCSSLGQMVALPSKHWSDFDSFSYPRELKPYMRAILNSFLSTAGDGLYPRVFCREAARAHHVFFELFVSDETFFHCLLAIAEGHHHMLVGDFNVSFFTLKCLSNTYRGISNDLAKNSVPTYGTIASVMSLVMHESLFGVVKISKLHLEALEKMINLKGGLHIFERYPALLHKICRSDLNFALRTGAQPRLYRDSFPRDEVKHIMTNIDANRAESFLEIRDETTRGVFNDCMNISYILNIHYTKSMRPITASSNGHENEMYKMHSFSFQEFLISVGYRLLRAHPLETPNTMNVFDKACYLALLAFIVSILIYPGPKPENLYQLLSDKLRHIITQLDSKNDPFKLWVCCIARISVIHSGKDGIIVDSILASLLQKLNIGTSAKASEILMQFPWIHYFHNEPSIQVLHGICIH
ncbi:uncharacterized protein PV09_04721 [Verruconis gallopava]|uniref:Uncharacterized protein n=1 Tax=Verruconis gallopava TaxID=253628 RepID=A0A0D1XPH1_9PEZI|nr:uncharacterized protein PV09_04721 [Verruconis gallopava]KIW04456.1 hypothetical protein PV09_04721 [Verruconis gallopava]